MIFNSVAARKTGLRKMNTFHTTIKKCANQVSVRVISMFLVMGLVISVGGCSNLYQYRWQRVLKHQEKLTAEQWEAIDPLSLIRMGISNGITEEDLAEFNFFVSDNQTEIAPGTEYDRTAFENINGLKPEIISVSLESAKMTGYLCCYEPVPLTDKNLERIIQSCCALLGEEKFQNFAGRKLTYDEIQSAFGQTDNYVINIVKGHICAVIQIAVQDGLAKLTVSLLYSEK